jgi:hypothetical protein
MLGISFLREIVLKEYITHTGVILRRLRKEIIKTLRQTGKLGEQKDGMDMSIISIDKNTNKMQYSGAINSLYIIKSKPIETDTYSILRFDDKNNNSKFLYEIKADKMPISIFVKMEKFTAHELQLEKGDIIYLFSDGYADQFGGDNGKKFKVRTFKQLLIDNADKSMSEQKKILQNTFENWKGNNEQIDDITVVGIMI